MVEEMPSQYDPAAAQARWYPQWVERGYFGADAGSDKPPFCIVLPPPNITGRLHMGHALNHTIQDILIRRKRMQGYEALWVPGTDHAGIATQVVVERALREEGIDRREMGREAFVERVWAWKERFGGEIVEQVKALGASCDWSRERFTMDEGLSQAVRVAFVRLYEAGLIYRGERLVNWCPTDHTGLSDSEVEHEDVDGELVTFKYPLADGSGDIEVATTRLETMLGDTGIAVNPKDERYASWVGKTVRHPFDDREIPIVADESVDMEFGTGAVKVTPAHDPNDWEIAERTGLPHINIFDANATLNDEVPQEFSGLERYVARERVREALAEKGLIVAEERPYRHAVGHCYRCRSEVEPWIAGKQWFVAVDELKGPAREAVKDGRIRFTPPRWARAYDTWMEGLRDWNISRQLWWGHRIPVWYCPEQHETPATQDPTACAECGSTDIVQDEDVLDTWFSSQLWPFSTLGWPEATQDLKSFYPTSVMVTAYDIIYLWVARMIMSGLFLVDGDETRTGDTIPFEQVVIHGIVRDEHGRKMSKSLGNVIDPLDMIERYGADALRFSLARMASPDQQNLPQSEASIEAGRNFANKLWNAARLVLRSGGVPELPPAEHRSVLERWLLSRHQACVDAVNDALDADEYAEASQALYRFVWSEFCDWGLELAKGRLYEGTDEEKAATANTFAWALERTLRLLHPVMPFVTEEIWQRFGRGDSIVVAAWPESAPELADEDAEREFGAVQDIVTDIRQLQAGIPTELSKNVTLAEDLRPAAEPWLSEVQRLTGAEVAFAQLEGVRVDVRISDGTDVGPILRRLEKKLAEVDGKLGRKRAKLANEGFLAKALPEVIAKEQRSVDELDEEAGRIRAQLGRLGG
ncbi:MAG: valine--tRNA ligase [Actinomycetota bacterium]